MEIYLIRHTSLYIESGICYGNSDIDLASTFDEEAIKVHNKIKDLKQLIFFSSPLKRCSLLADKLSNSNFIQDDRLKELNFGEWENKSFNSLEKNSDFLDWMKDYTNYKCPKGESFKDLYLRSSDFISETVNYNYKQVALITHCGVIRSILAYILKLPLEDVFKFKIDYGSFSKVEFINNSFYIDFLNK